MEEYFHQSDREKIDSLPVAPFMDRLHLTDRQTDRQTNKQTDRQTDRQAG